MSASRRDVARAAAMAVLAATLSSTAGAATCPAELSRCVAIAAAEARLACYDALAGRTDSVAAAPVPPSITPAVATGGASPAVANPVAAPPSAPPATAAAIPAAPERPGPESFGLSEARVRAPQTGPESIQAKVVTLSSDRLGHALVRLDNGQVWAFNETDVQLDPAEPVTIRRAALGSYLLETANRRSYRVQRLK